MQSVRIVKCFLYTKWGGRRASIPSLASSSRERSRRTFACESSNYGFHARIDSVHALGEPIHPCTPRAGLSRVPRCGVRMRTRVWNHQATGPVNTPPQWQCGKQWARAALRVSCASCRPRGPDEVTSTLVVLTLRDVASSRRSRRERRSGSAIASERFMRRPSPACVRCQPTR